MVSADGLAGQSPEPGPVVVIRVIDHYRDRGACCDVVVWSQSFGRHRWAGEAITGGGSRRAQREAGIRGAVRESGA